MANEQNLVKGEDRHKFTHEEHSKGGKASAKARREQKIFKQAIAERMGFDDFNEMIDNLIKRAKGNDKSFEVLRDTMGQKPVERQEIHTTINDPYDELSVEELKKLANEK